ncbi:hypothetical protein [Candidatus Xianfuyuplasma coldseepsis]|uniref:Uncharacterized protein n=1 Tax=Candidatus Xianfuyuplasma coldseepsis TaxID=2782163 RepID=A0A7L7KQ22_9MOLU|nr:hypothetical protein [Xianfuyuplasma coldseepsis]QMS84675.1 hypothetical protein G4Z02_02550 [Xianfuyuplasma coldseepsis]
MSIQEKRVLANLLSTIVITTIFAIIVYNRYMDLESTTESVMKFWATALLLFIPASITARIIVMILFSIGNEIAGEIKKELTGEDTDKNDLHIMDERDKVIDLLATRISLVGFSAGFIIALATQVMDYSVTVFFVTMLIAGFASDVLAELYKISKYRGWL